MRYPIAVREDGTVYVCQTAIDVANQMILFLKYSRDEAINAAFQLQDILKRQTPQRYDECFYDSLRRQMDTQYIEVILQCIEPNELLSQLNIQRTGGNTSIHRMVSHQNSETLKGVLKRFKTGECQQLLNVRNMSGDTALHDACMSGHKESVRIILSQLTMKYDALQTASLDGCTPLHHAACNQYDIIIQLIHKSVKCHQWIKFLQRRNVDGMTVLQHLVFWRLDTHFFQATLDTLKNSVTPEAWLDQLSATLPDFDPNKHREDNYLSAVNWFDHRRTAAKIQRVIDTDDPQGTRHAVVRPVCVTQGI